MGTGTCQIVCFVCHEQFSSPVQFETAGAFFNSFLVGARVVCSRCGKETACQTENMKYVVPDEKRRFVGEDV